MEAAGALRRSSISTYLESIGDARALALANLLDRRRPHRSGRGAALRHARRAELPPRRDRHRQPHPARRLLARDGRGRLQRVGAAALLRGRLGLDPADRHRRVRPALGLGRRRRRHGAGRLPARGRAEQPPRRHRRRGPGRGQPDAALVLAGGPRLRALRPAHRALAALLRPRPGARPSPRLDRLGRSPRPSPSPPTTSPPSRSPPRRSGCCAAGAGKAAAPSRASGSSSARACCWRRCWSTRRPSPTPNGSATSASGTGSGRPASPSPWARPATSSPGPSTRCWRSFPA